MKKVQKVSTFLLVLSLTGCGFFKSADPKKEETASTSPGESLDGAGSELFLEDNGGMAQDKEPLLSEEPMVTENTPPLMEEASTPKIMGGSMETYQVQKGDTLMLISYKLYGHHRNWKEILKLNPGKIKGHNALIEGTQLTYTVPDTVPVIPLGLPYLIKLGDSLSLISGKVYGDVKQWKPIYENNKVEITDPNVIYAGFTIYYPEKDQLKLSKN